MPAANIGQGTSGDAQGKVVAILGRIVERGVDGVVAVVGKGVVGLAGKALGAGVAGGSRRLERRRGEDDAVTGAEHRLGIDGEGDAETWTEILVLCRGLAAAVFGAGLAHKAHGAFQGVAGGTESRRHARSRDRGSDGRGCVGVPIGELVVAFCAGKLYVPAQTCIDGEPLRRLPLILRIQRDITACLRGGDVVGLVAVVGQAKQKAREAIAVGAVASGVDVLPG